ncbi:MAG TPA: hypothetical protein VHC45_08110 [Gaiellaceae bacterium]|nr:hypothetical protein [Gaiellaceae bacterium]
MQEQALAEFLAAGVAGVAATRDERLRPTIARAWAPVLLDEDTRLRICLEAAPGSPARANLESNGTIAATFTLPSSYRSAQVKGSVLELRQPTSDELAAVDEHVASFSREAEAVGLMPDSGRRLIGPELVTAVIEIRELYDQTPGASAGARL